MRWLKTEKLSLAEGFFLTSKNYQKKISHLANLA